MVDNTQIFIIACITILYFILPAYVSNGSALVLGGGIPLDFKKQTKMVTVGLVMELHGGD